MKWQVMATGLLAAAVCVVITVDARSDIFTTTDSVNSQILNHAGFQSDPYGWWDTAGHKPGGGYYGDADPGHDLLAFGHGIGSADSYGLIKFANPVLTLNPGERVVVNSATLSLTFMENVNYEDVTVFNVYPITSIWDYKNDGWSEQPAVDTVRLLGSFNAGGGNPQVSVSITGDALKTLVQTWIDDSSANYGVEVRGPEAWRTKLFASAESVDARRPTLSVEYTVVPEPSALMMLGLLGSIGMLLRFGRLARIWWRQ